jgi:hypothetical protein
MREVKWMGREGKYCVLANQKGENNCAENVEESVWAKCTFNG